MLANWSADTASAPTLAVARKLAAYLLAVDKSRQAFQLEVPSEMPT